MSIAASTVVARPLPVVHAGVFRRAAVDRELAPLGACHSVPPGEVLPTYVDAQAALRPPHYNPFQSPRQAYWQVTGVPRLAAAGAGVLVLGGGAGAAAFVSRACFDVAVQTCLAALDKSANLCAWAFHDGALTTAACAALCASNPDSVSDAAWYDAPSAAQPLVRHAAPAGVMALAALVGIGVGMGVQSLVAKGLYNRRPDVVAAQTRNRTDDVALQAFDRV